MLVQVDAFTGESAQPEPFVTHYACVATVDQQQRASGQDSTTADGVWMSFGRHANSCSVAFSGDKTVSRKHLLLRCVQLAPTSAASVAPRNDEERAACEANPFSMCLVLESLSKSGTYVAIPKALEAQEEANDDDSHTEDGNGHDSDATDDEGVSQAISQSQSSMLMPPNLTTKALLGSRSVRLHQLLAGDSYILPLEKYLAAGCACVVQLGGKDSNIAINMLPWKMAFSRNVGKSLEMMQASLPSLGCLLQPDSLPDTRTTHLVTAQCQTGAKQIIAWCLGLKIVTPAFVEALQSRKATSESLPDPNDFQSPIRAADAFFHEKPNPSLLRKFTLLSLVDDEKERLAVAAGCHCVALHKEEDIMEAVTTILEERHDKTILFYIAARANRILDRMEIPRVTGKSLASSITKSRAYLEDVSGTKLGSEDDDIDVDMEEAPPQSLEDTQPKETETSMTSSQKAALSKAQVKAPVKSPARSKSSRTVENTTSQESDLNVSAEMLDDINNKSVSQTEEEGSPEVAPQPVLSSLPAVQDEKTRDSQETGNQSFPAGSTTAPEASLGDTKAILGGPDSNGWFSLADRNPDARKAMRKRAGKMYMAVTGGSALLPSAFTEHITISVIAPANPVSEPSTVRKKSGPNYSRFKKNIVFRAPPGNKVVLEEVLARESVEQMEQLRELEELEEEQRRADELFREMAGPRTTKRRRRL